MKETFWLFIWRGNLTCRWSGIRVLHINRVRVQLCESQHLLPDIQPARQEVLDLPHSAQEVVQLAREVVCQAGLPVSIAGLQGVVHREGETQALNSQVTLGGGWRSTPGAAHCRAGSGWRAPPSPPVPAGSQWGSQWPPCPAPCRWPGRSGDSPAQPARRPSLPGTSRRRPNQTAGSVWWFKTPRHSFYLNGGSKKGFNDIRVDITDVIFYDQFIDIFPNIVSRPKHSSCGNICGFLAKIKMFSASGHHLSLPVIACWKCC